MYNDTIADALTRIRNAYLATKLETTMPYSKMKETLLMVLKQHNFIDTYVVEGDGVKKTIQVVLAYDSNGKPKVEVIRRVSRPSLRKYITAKEIGFTRGGYGISIISTSQGVMADQEAKKKGLGGEVIAEVW